MKFSIRLYDHAGVLTVTREKGDKKPRMKDSPEQAKADARIEQIRDSRARPRSNGHKGDTLALCIMREHLRVHNRCVRAVGNSLPTTDRELLQSALLGAEECELLAEFTRRRAIELRHAEKKMSTRYRRTMRI